MSTKGLSLKYKVMLLLTMIPLILLGAYLFLVIGIFKKDKIAYIYDTNGSVNRSIAAQTRGIFTMALTTAKPIIQEYISISEFGLFSKQTLENESNLRLVAILEMTNDRIIIGDHIEKQSEDYQDIIKQSSSLNILIKNLGNDGRVVRTPFNDDRLLLIESLGIQNGSTKKYMALIFRSPELEDLYSTNSSRPFMLSTETGDLLFHRANNDQTLAIYNNTFFKKVQNQKGSEGTDLIKYNGESYLASYFKIGFGQLIVSSAVNQEQALSATKILIGKSLLFGGFLICIALFISIFGSQTVTGALQQLLEATKRISGGDFTSRIRIQNTDEIGQLANSFNLMSSEVARLLNETAEKARMESELQTAQTVQETLFPPSETKYMNVAISGYYAPASEIGGDWWYHCRIQNKVLLCIGDATGHGASAALITSAARSATSVLENLNLEPQQIIRFLNKAIYDVSRGKVMMTFFLAIIDLENGTLTYANASHDPPFLIKASSNHPKKRDLNPLMEITDPRLGQNPDSHYKQVTIQLDPDDTLFFYTDGVADIRDPSNTPLGERDFIKFLIKALELRENATHVVNSMLQNLGDYKQNGFLVDDVTFFCVKYERAS